MPMRRPWFLALLLALSCLLLPAAWAGAPASAPEAQAEPPERLAGSYDVAPVRILGIPAISVASPVVGPGQDSPDARRRATVIEGNLSLLYRPQTLCSGGETVAESLLETLVLGGPDRLCTGDPWNVLGTPQDLTLVVAQADQGPPVLEARLKGRPEALPLLTVTAADAQLHGQTPSALAARWRVLLQRRLRHARLTMQPDQLAIRLRAAVAVELFLALTLGLSFWGWSQLRSRLRARQRSAQTAADLQGLRPQLLMLLGRLLFLAVLVQLVIMLALGVTAVPGQIPLGMALLMQPIAVLFKLLLLGLVAFLLRLLAAFVLRQWVSSLRVPMEERARRDQRYRNLVQASQRLIDLGCIAVLVILVLADIPGISELSFNAVLAGGALLGGLAIAFQGLLRDFVAGLVVLIDDHYAVGDWVEIDRLEGDVVDVGLLVTVLRAADQRVVVVQNSSCQRLVNHTKIRSGIDVVLPLAVTNADLPGALAVIGAELELFASDPLWSLEQVAPPLLRGVNGVGPLGIEVSVMLTTRTGRQWACQRELLARLITRLQREGIALAGAPAAMPLPS